ncbi:protein of unknown function DUF323 [hydrothermal vent metagenome]|uniref:Sulfatase-modifying factor enzyme-like domain-containing protein n=1 Tax=hydrothermal vent metagenome TaxID=652676 RepID=A0A3B1DHY6_9ZZZZ
MVPYFKSTVFCLSLVFLSALLLTFDFSVEAKEKTTVAKTKVAQAECKKCGESSNSEAKTEKEMKAYKLLIPQTEVSFEMVPIKGGEFVMGSPSKEKGRNKDEGPQHKVKIEPFWMGKYEVTWDEYDIWTFGNDITRRMKLKGVKPTPRDADADAASRPSLPYTDMTFDYGHDRYPAICVTQLSAKVYCEWLSAKTGHYYRLPTEAEWEYACRAGTTTAFSFGNDVKKIDDYAWNEDNSDFEPHPIGKKKPNPWGLYDMHGNVAEWCLDKYDADFYQKFADAKVKPLLNVPSLEHRYGRIVRGGSWDQKPLELRSASRMKSVKDWKQLDPQIPQSDWYLTDAHNVGFRIIRPLKAPSKAVRRKLMLDSVKEEIDRIPSTKKKTGKDFLEDYMEKNKGK